MSGKPLRQWMRDRLLAAAGRQTDDPVFVELIAVRMLLNCVLQNIAGGRAMAPDEFQRVMLDIRDKNLTPPDGF